MSQESDSAGTDSECNSTSGREKKIGEKSFSFSLIHSVLCLSPVSFHSGEESGRHLNNLATTSV
jgi:hypothetical protein